jgi:hypothetical protein
VVGEYGAVSKCLIPLSEQTLSNSTGPGPSPNRAVKTFPLSVSTCSGTPCARSAPSSASDRSGRCPHHDPRAHHEPGVVIDAGHELHLPTVGQERPAHHVHLPQLHRPAAFPAPVVLPLPSALPALDPVMAQQRSIDRRAARQRLDAVPLELPHDPRRPPRRMLPAHRHDRRLHQRRHLMRTRLRLRRPVRQPRQTAVVGIPPQPFMHRLPSDPIPPRDLGDRRAFQYLEHRPIPLLHDTQLHQHRRPSRRDLKITTSEQDGLQRRK